MSGQPVVIAGAGGSGRETLCLLRDIEEASPGTWDFRGFLATEVPDFERLERIDGPFLGSPFDVCDRIPKARDWAFIVGIGDGTDRRRMDEVLGRQGLDRATLVHPTALIGGDVHIGSGSVICAQSVITTNVRLGEGCQLNIGCVVAHDARIGSFVTLAQGVNVAGNVEIDDEATLYTRAAIGPGVHIGSHAVIGAAALVLRDVPSNTTVVGVPARPRA